MTTRLVGLELTQEYETLHFPFDEQTVDIVLQSRPMTILGHRIPIILTDFLELEQAAGDKAQALCPRTDWMHSFRASSLSGWKQFAISGEPRNAHGDASPAARHIAGAPDVEVLELERYSVHVHVYRDPYSGWLNYILPVLATTLLNFVGYTILPDDIGSRLGLSVTIVLTLTAFKTAVGESVPASGYPTDLDVFFAEQLTISIATSVMFGVTAIVDRNQGYGFELDYIFGSLLLLSYLHSSWRVYQNYRQTLKRESEPPEVVMARVVQRALAEAATEADQDQERDGQTESDMEHAKIVTTLAATMIRQALRDKQENWDALALQDVSACLKAHLLPGETKVWGAKKPKAN